MIFSATPTASRIKGTGIKAAADCNTFKVCFPVAMIYCAVEGTTSRRLSDDIWIQMCVRDKARYESILSPLAYNSSPKYLVPPQKYSPSLPRRSLVHVQAVPGWRCGSESSQDMSHSYRRLGIRLQKSVLHRGTLVRCRDGRYFILRLFLDAVNYKGSLNNLVNCSP